MINGNWIPLDKGLVKFLPTDRKYSELEAMFSISVDYDNGKEVSINGYCELFKWSKKKFYRFINEYGIQLEKSGKKKSPVKSLVRVQLDKKKRPVRFVDSKAFVSPRDQSEEKKSPVSDQLRDCTIYPINPNPKKKSKLKKPKKVFEEDSIEMKISRFLVNVLRKSEPELRDPNWQNWCKEIDKLLRINKKTPGEIKELILYAHNPENTTPKFSWIPNLRCPKKLRDKFTQIQLEMKNKQHHSKTQNQTTSKLDSMREETEKLLKK